MRQAVARAALPDAAARRLRHVRHAPRTDGDARPGRPRRHRADDDRQLHAQRALGARAEGHRGVRAAGRSMLNGYPMVNYGVARARELIDAIDKPAIMLTGTTMPRLTSEIAFAGRLFRVSRLRHRVHDVVHQGAVDRGRHSQPPVPRSTRRDVPRARRRAASAAAGLPHRHQHPAVDRDRHLRARLPARRGAGREELRPRDGRDAAPDPGRGGGRRRAASCARNICARRASTTCSRRSRCCTG